MSIFVSRTLDYSMRSLIYLAQQDDAGHASSLREISEETAIPRSYLAKLMRELVKGGVVRSDAGTNGGYHLSTKPEELSLRAVYELVEGPFRTLICSDDHQSCQLYDDCTQVPIWSALEREMVSVLEKWTLDDFIKESAPTPKQLISIEQLTAPQG